MKKPSLGVHCTERVYMPSSSWTIFEPPVTRLSGAPPKLVNDWYPLEASFRDPLGSILLLSPQLQLNLTFHSPLLNITPSAVQVPPSDVTAPVRGVSPPHPLGVALPIILASWMLYIINSLVIWS